MPGRFAALQRLYGDHDLLTGTITAAEVLIDVQGTADLSNITFNGVSEVPTVGGPATKNACKRGGWKSFTNPSFKNQGRCVSFFEHQLHGQTANHHGDDDNDDD